MATMNFSVPEDLKAAFNEAFADQNKSAVVSQLMREAIARAQAQRRSQSAADRLLARHGKAAQRSAATLAKSRIAGRP